MVQASTYFAKRPVESPKKHREAGKSIALESPWKIRWRRRVTVQKKKNKLPGRIPLRCWASLLFPVPANDSKVKLLFMHLKPMLFGHLRPASLNGYLTLENDSCPTFGVSQIMGVRPHFFRLEKLHCSHSKPTPRSDVCRLPSENKTKRKGEVVPYAFS